MKTINVNLHLHLPPSLIYASNNEREIRAGYFKVEYHAPEKNEG
jgi:hypothetical protein